MNREIESRELVEKDRKGRLLRLILLLALFFYLGLSWGKASNDQQTDAKQVDKFVNNLISPSKLFRNANKNKPAEVDFDLFWEAWEKLDKKHINQEKLGNYQERVYGAIRGMVGALDDPYSGFMDPKETDDFNTEMNGSFDGIGAELGMKEGVLTVIAPIDDTPAKKADLRSGDKIIKIDGDLTNEITVDEAVNKIRGERGTKVVLTVMREGEAKTKDIEIVRGKIEVSSVTYKKEAGGIAYLRISKFTDNTAKEFNRVVTEMIADGTKGIILDLRYNPGGFLHEAVKVTSEFIPKGEVVVWEEGKNGKRKSYKALGGDSLSALPVVVIINEGSASASEILAGALRDVRRAKLVGEKSFGKGSVQEVVSLSDKSDLRITIAKWLTPAGQSIHDVGLEPDEKVEITEGDLKNKNDRQKQRALELLREQIK